MMALRRSLLILPLIFASVFHAQMAGAGVLSYAVDILSSQYYPQLRDAWFTRINNQGLAAGYIATASSSGPYLPATYTGNGNFHTLGVSSWSYSQTVTGLNDHGDLVGTLNYSIPYLYQNGALSYVNLPDNLSEPYMAEINNGGLATGFALDHSTETYQVFTVTNGMSQVLPLRIDGFAHFITSEKWLSDSGLLGIEAYTPDLDAYQDFVLNLATNAIHPLATPDGYDNAYLLQITRTGLIIGSAYSQALQKSIYGFWNADGSFQNVIDTPDGIRGVRFNDLGQAVGILNGTAYVYDGTSWREAMLNGLSGYALNRIDDFNNRGEFVGLVREGSRNFFWGYVARQIPEPGTLTLAALGLLGLICSPLCRPRRGR